MDERRAETLQFIFNHMPVEERNLVDGLIYNSQRDTFERWGEHFPSSREYRHHSGWSTGISLDNPEFGATVRMQYVTDPIVRENLKKRTTFHMNNRVVA